MTNSFDRSELLTVFLAESEENLATLEQLLVTLESSRDEEIVHAVFRAAHTLKGNSASVGFDSVARVAHVMEDLLDGVRNAELQPTSRMVNLLLQGTDAIKLMLPEAVDGVSELPLHVLSLLEEMREIGAHGRAHDTIMESAVYTESLAAPVAGITPAAVEPMARPAAGSKRIRVDLNRLDRLLNLTGEMGIARGRILTAIESLEKGMRERFLEAMEESDRLLESLRQEVTGIRMLPVGVALQPHKRVIHDLSAAHGKQVSLVLEGEDVEIDASLVEQIKDPLTHMIRNAIDHGIEPAEVRRSIGKPAVATLTLRAFRDGSGIVIQVRDDGAGFDRSRILARARERGMISGDESLSPKAVWSLVFAPGFTTVDGLAVGAGGERFIVPMDAIEECIELPASIASDQAAGIIMRRGSPMPFLRLDSFFQLGAPAGEVRSHVVVVRNGDQPFGLVTDVLYGETQAMIKPLGKLFQSFTGVAGSTIFADGRVGLILDVPGLVRETARREAAATAH